MLECMPDHMADYVSVCLYLNMYTLKCAFYPNCDVLRNSVLKSAIQTHLLL